MSDRGPLLRMSRKRLGLTQAELAERAEVSVKTIYNLEHDKFAEPNELQQVAAALGLSEGDLGLQVSPEAAGYVAELEALRRYPRGVFVALMVWGAFLEKMPEDEQEIAILAISQHLASQAGHEL